MLGDSGVVTKRVADIDIELIVHGEGRPLLFLHPAIGIEPNAAILDELGRHVRVIAPSHPGFGRTPNSPDFTTVDDLSYFYLDLLRAFDLRDTIVVGVSFGAWIAAEIAVKCTNRISCMILADALGIKVGNREQRDIVDIFAATEDDFTSLAFADPAAFKRDYGSLSDERLLAVARNREAAARYGWSPYMHNPKLRARLRRIDVPTLVLWGSEDRIVRPDYGRAYCAEIPGATFELIEGAGHFPHIERPLEFSRHVLRFAEAVTPVAH
jgi:pimeloyl-ACP methyl ester carboxylesterase